MNKILRILCWYFTIQVFIFIKGTIFHGKSSVQQDQGYFYQQTELKFEEKDTKTLQLSISFTELNVEHFGTKSEIL
jgi:hypothetical protein